MKKVLILTNYISESASNYPGHQLFISSVTKLLKGKYSVENAFFSELAYLADGYRSRVWHPEKGWDVADFDLVVFRVVGSEIELGIATAHYAYMTGTAFIDSYLLTQSKGKLVGAFLRSANNLPVPKTFHGSREVFEKVFKTDPPFNFPVILKADFGRKGRDNYLVKNLNELLGKIDGSPDISFVAQNFIPNDGDYRILVLNYKPRLAIHRQSVSGSHLNNTSQGGTAKSYSLDKFSKKILRDSRLAARLEELEVAGVDIVINKENGRHYILEVNRAPQLATGAFGPKKLRAYTEALDDILARTPAKSPNGGRMLHVGRVESIRLPDYEISVRSRIDTGAKTSAIWASDIKLAKDGKLSFKLFGKGSPFYTGQVISTKAFSETVVASSNGKLEKRYKVRLVISLKGKKMRVAFTLTDRSQMTYPILVGRNVLSGNFIVNVKIGKPLVAAEKARTASMRRLLQRSS